jgi:CheY-like chemotaxis protein
MTPPPEAAGPAILVADDDPGMRRFVGECLKARGFVVREVQDGISACEQAEANPPALVLLDLVLPRRDGYAVLLHLRSREATRTVPVVLMSGESEGEQAEVARTLGAQAFIPKPFTRSDLISTVEAALKIKAGQAGSP